MLSKETMYAMIRSWVMIPRKGVWRIHISHNDMDGYGCTLVSRLMHTYCSGNNKKNYRFSKKNDIIFSNCDVNKDKVMDCIVRNLIWLRDNTPFEPMRDVISIMITDIGQFDPAMLEEASRKVFREYVPIEYLVVDHHQDKLKIGESEKATALIESARGLLHCAWFSFTDCSAMLHMANAFNTFTDPMNEFDERLSDQYPRLDTFNFSTIWRNLYSLAEHISESDTGSFGNWYAEDFGIVDATARNRILWSWYMEHGGPEKWYEDHFYAYSGHNNPLCSDETVTYHNNMWAYLVEAYWAKQLNEYLRFKENLRMAYETCCPILPEELTGKYVAAYIELTDNDGTKLYPSYSLFAKRYLDENMTGEEGPYCDIIVGVDFKDEEYSFRSRAGGADVSEIATKLGGGGHICAAGCKIPDEFWR